MRVMKAIGLDNVEFDHTSAQPLSEQFWAQFDNLYNLNEIEMRKQLPQIVGGENVAKVEAGLGEETTQRLA